MWNINRGSIPTRPTPGCPASEPRGKGATARKHRDTEFPEEGRRSRPGLRVPGRSGNVLALCCTGAVWAEMFPNDAYFPAAYPLYLAAWLVKRES